MSKRDQRGLSPAVYLINLDRAPERLSAMQKKLDLLGVAFERVKAVDGQDIKLQIKEFDETRYRSLHGRRVNLAEIGCYLSHIECARRLLCSQHAVALILEDDLDFSADLPEILEAAVQAEADWDILRLSTVSTGKKYSFRNITSDRTLAIALTREKGSGAYLINRRAAQWFIDGLLPMWLPFDLAFDLEFLGGLKAAFVSPVPIRQDIGLPSQIQGKHRSFHLSRWYYVRVLPFRTGVEIARAIFRMRRLLVARSRQRAINWGVRLSTFLTVLRSQRANKETDVR